MCVLVYVCMCVRVFKCVCVCVCVCVCFIQNNLQPHGLAAVETGNNQSVRKSFIYGTEIRNIYYAVIHAATKLTMINFGMQRHSAR